MAKLAIQSSLPVWIYLAEDGTVERVEINAAAEMYAFHSTFDVGAKWTEVPVDEDRNDRVTEDDGLEDPARIEVVVGHRSTHRLEGRR